MRPVLFGISALEYWRSSLSDPTPGDMGNVENPVVGKVFGSGKSPSKRRRKFDDIAEIDDAISRTEGAKGKLHLLMDPSFRKRRFSNIECHSWNKGALLTSDSVINAGTGFDVVSPELCLMQVAPQLTRFQLMRAITDLCARYSLSALDRSGIISRAPVTTLESIRAYVEKTPGLNGYRKVDAALCWCLEGSRSPRETTMSLFFRLPTRLGGKQLPVFVPNMKFSLGQEARLLTKKTYLEGDAVWPDAKLVIEYNSDAYHDTEEAKEFDFEKITALESMGYTVVPISTRQFNSYDSLEVIVMDLRQRLGSGTKKRAEDEKVVKSREKRSRKTHEELLGEERRQRELPSLLETARWRYLQTLM